MPNASPLVARSGIVPLLVHEASAADVVNAYFTATSPEAFDRMRGERPADAPWNSYKIQSGVALIPVMGSLIPRGTFAGPLYGVTSYEGLQSELRRAKADASVDSVALMIDSPGGYVSNLDATAAAILDLRKEKTVTAYVQGMACSAAYWLASQADEIVCSPQSELGSIGVVQAHFDMSSLLEQIGIKVTLLHAGTKKVDGNPYEPLSERVKTEMNQRLEDLRMAFAEAVASGRASLDVAAVLATEAATYVGEDAVKRGLADRVGFLAEDIDDDDDNEFLPGFTLGRFMERSMTTYTQAQFDAAVNAARESGKTEGHATGHAAGLVDGKKAGHDAGHAEGLAAGKVEGHAAAKAEGLEAGAKAERERISGIRGSEEAQKRPKAAEHVAMTTNMPVDAAKSFLAGLPEEKAEKSLEQEMSEDPASRTANLVGADGGLKLDNLKGEAKGAAIAMSLGLGKKKTA